MASKEPYRLLRVGHDNGAWEVEVDGEVIATVFKYLGYWRINSGDARPRSSRFSAANTAYEDWLLARAVTEGQEDQQ